MKGRFIDIREMVEHARRVKDGGAFSRSLVRKMALTLLQLHAGYERQRAELVRTAPRGSHGPGEWWGFHSDEVPSYPTFIHHQGHVKVRPDVGAAKKRSKKGR